MNEPIRLTNKTARAIRKSAQRLRRAYFAFGLLLSLLLTAAGVALGLKWLPAMPLMLALAALIDGGLWIAARSRYLELLGQAICTEAAAREIRTGISESLRREMALSDMIRVKADAQQGHKENKEGAKPFFEPERETTEAEKEESVSAAAGAAAPHRRRRTAGGDTKSLQLIKGDK